MDVRAVSEMPGGPIRRLQTLVIEGNDIVQNPKEDGVIAQAPFRVSSKNARVLIQCSGTVIIRAGDHKRHHAQVDVYAIDKDMDDKERSLLGSMRCWADNRPKNVGRSHWALVPKTFLVDGGLGPGEVILSFRQGHPHTGANVYDAFHALIVEFEGDGA